MRRVKINGVASIPEGSIGYFKSYRPEHNFTTAVIELDGKDQVLSFGQYEYIDPPEEEMTLRDQFAGMALSGLLADTRFITSRPNSARIAYEYADAMLEDRKVEK